MTPLIVACMENHEDMVNYFLDHTQEPYRVKVHPNSLQQQPQLQVMENAQGEKMCEGKWILATQTQVLDCNKAEKTEGETPLLVCIRLRNDKIAKTILKKAKSIDLEAKVCCNLASDRNYREYSSPKRSDVIWLFAREGLEAVGIFLQGMTACGFL